ncbi:hypothetical protein PFISCL1PPCAC_19265, partial [Pristionchus fissidentatus]
HRIFWCTVPSQHKLHYCTHRQRLGTVFRIFLQGTDICTFSTRYCQYKYLHSYRDTRHTDLPPSTRSCFLHWKVCR